MKFLGNAKIQKSKFSLHIHFKIKAFNSKSSKDNNLLFGKMSVENQGTSVGLWNIYCIVNCRRVCKIPIQPMDLDRYTSYTRITLLHYIALTLILEIDIYSSSNKILVSLFCIRYYFSSKYNMIFVVSRQFNNSTPHLYNNLYINLNCD